MLKVDAGNLPDLLIYNNDTFCLDLNPLLLFPEENAEIEKKLFGGEGCNFSKAFVSKWEIVDSTLYLVEIENPCFPIGYENVEFLVADSIGAKTADLQLLFPEYYEGGKVKATWLTDKIFSPQGDLLPVMCGSWGLVYEKEIAFDFEKGKLTDVFELDNSKYILSDYAHNEALLNEFLTKEMDSANISQTDSQKRTVIVSIDSVAENGKIELVTIKRGVNDFYDKKAVRLVKQIPVWDVIYVHGEICKEKLMIPITFDLRK